MPYFDNKTSTALYMRSYIHIHNISDLLKKSCPSFVNLPALDGFIEEDVSSYIVMIKDLKMLSLTLVNLHP